MNLIKQIQGISYSLIFGFIFTFIYSLINRLFYQYHKRIFRLILQIIIGIIFGYLYYVGLLVINNGVIRGYFIISLLVGYILYLNYYGYYMYRVIEIIVNMLKYLIRPIAYAYKKISAIIKTVGKVRRWLKGKFTKQSKDLPI